jgi:EAL domain-containing protein (putative c-di-GMP-specific phosphodiesterase class I)
MIKAIAQLAKVMCMETIAEYVETDNLRVRMADLGVDYGQGFAMGKAQPLKELLRRTGDLRSHRQHDSRINTHRAQVRVMS